MRKTTALAICLAVLMTVPLAAQLTLPRPSPNAKIAQTVGLTDITITYSRPGVKDRTIWGELVPYDKVWRTGANEATIVSFADDVTVNGNKLAAGSYSLHTIPGKEEWTLIFNSAADPKANYSYDESKDVLRVKVKPETTGHMHERMMFVIPNVTDTSADIALEWEKVKVPFKVEVDTMTKLQAAAKTEIASASADAWRVPYQAANWAYTNKLAWPELDQWLEQSLKARETYSNLVLKARLLADKGKKADAIATAEKAIKIAKEGSATANVSQAENLIKEWKGK